MGLNNTPRPWWIAGAAMTSKANTEAMTSKANTEAMSKHKTFNE